MRCGKLKVEPQEKKVRLIGLWRYVCTFLPGWIEFREQIGRERERTANEKNKNRVKAQWNTTP